MREQAVIVQISKKEYTTDLNYNLLNDSLTDLGWLFRAPVIRPNATGVSLNTTEDTKSALRDKHFQSGITDHPIDTKKSKKVWSLLNNSDHERKPPLQSPAAITYMILKTSSKIKLTCADICTLIAKKMPYYQFSEPRWKV